MRILIINCNREHKPQTLLPIGACCIAAATNAVGYDTHFLDLTFARNPVRTVQSTVQRLAPDVIGLSIRNLDNCDATAPYSYLPEIQAIAAACRQACTATLVLGGAAVSLAPGSMLRNVPGDYAVVGEGERTFLALLRALEQGVDPSSIPGVIAAEQDSRSAPYPQPLSPRGARGFRDAESPSAPRGEGGGRGWTGGEQSVAPLEEHLPTLPDVDFSRWLSLQQYRAFDAAYPIQTKRGCQFQCNYCRYPYLEGRHWRLRDPGWVAEEVARAEASGLRLIEFIDSVFGLPTGHAIACCAAASRRGARTALSAMELNPAACVPDLVQAMNAARFSSVAITAESGSAAMLAQLQKGFTTDDLHRAAETLRDLRTQKMWIFLVGAPGECAATVRETARFIATLPPTDFVYATFGVRVLPGTALQRTLIGSGELDAENDLLQPFFYHSPLIDPARA
ncbi:MAG TPA: cobalamin-dependent protein, partial [Armatimonadota bacterium]